jgi:SAM-dependent methyltransferase
VTQEVIARFIALNQRWSKRVDALLDRRGRRVDGCSDFLRFLGAYLRPGLRVLDVGGGKRPIVPLALKSSHKLCVIGLDVSATELADAPPGFYDQTICCDICSAANLPELDLALSCDVTEHVRQPVAMYSNIYRALLPGGIAINFMPNKFAPFALANAALPNAFAKRIVDYFYPETKSGQGFPTYYRTCFPSGMKKLLERIGFQDVQVHPYYRSEYLSFFLPFHFFELMWQLLTSRLGQPNLCETFVVSAKKPLT